MSSPPIDTFRRSLERADSARARMEFLFVNRSINLGDIHSVYEALFLRGVTSFEFFLETLFIGILSGKLQYPRSRVRLRMEVTNQQALLDILLQNSSYLQWTPFQHAERRARLYLVGGRPFTELNDGDRSIIKTVTVIRNAIAHSSNFAKREFAAKVIGSTALLRGERSPAGFLRSISNPNQRRFEVYMIELARIALRLS